MKLTRTRLILAGTVAALIAVAGLVMMLQGGGNEGKNAGPGALTTAFGGIDVAQGAPAAAPSYSDADSVVRALRPSDEGAGSIGAPGAEQAATGGAPPGQGGQPATLPDVLGRKIVQTTDIDVQVKEVPRAFQDIVRIATAAGGFVASSSFTNADDQQIADLTIRVPSEQYQSVLADIRATGEPTAGTSDANDVTEEYTDLQARMRTLQATEQRYLDLLAKAETVNDILVLQDRLDSVRGQIEQVQGRINLLERLSNLATITVHLRPLGVVAQATTGGGGAHPINAAQNAWERSLDALRGLAAAALVVTVFSWWLVPPLALVALAARWWLAHRPAPNTQTT